MFFLCMLCGFSTTYKAISVTIYVDKHVHMIGLISIKFVNGLGH